MSHQLTLPGTVELRPMTFLSHGLGVQSNALSVLLNEHPDFAEYRPDAIAHVDTGADVPHVLQVSLPAMRAYHEAHGQELVVLGCDDPRYQTPSKTGTLDEQYRRQPTPGIPTRSFRSCTFNKKIAPFRKWVNELSDLRHGKWGQAGRRHRVIIGISADEAQRTAGESHAIDPTAQYIEVVYPLIEHGWTRQMCVALLRSRGLPALKSGCFLCPFQPMAWWWAIRELYPELHARSVATENAARAHNPKLILTRKLPLDDAINEWASKQTDLPSPHEVLSGTYKRGDKAWKCSPLQEVTT